MLARKHRSDWTALKIAPRFKVINTPSTAPINVPTSPNQ